MENTTERLIRNASSLISHGLTTLRRDALEIAEAGIRRAIPYETTKRLLTVSGDTLSVAGREYSLGELEHIYVIGVGKGAYPIARAMEERLGGRISEGVVLVKSGDCRRLRHIEVLESGHPIPDERGVEGAKKILSILRKAGERDLLLAAITGGSSAMMNLPPEGVTLRDLQEINRLLLRSGADIAHMNAVRKHLCRMKGGHLVELAAPAPLHTFTLDTNPPGLLWPDLVYADPSTFADAVRVLRDYGIWDAAPEGVKAHLLRGCDHPEMETPKRLSHRKNYIHSVADPDMACRSAAERAAELGYAPHILSTALDGEARELGVFLACVANQIAATDEPFCAPCALISGGETTVSIASGVSGTGGPNQETALGFVLRVREDTGAVCVSLDSDGTDGPTDIAGGIADALTARRAQALGLRLEEALAAHDASPALQALEDAVITGHTGTNIMNLRVVLVGKEEAWQRSKH